MELPGKPTHRPEGGPPTGAVAQTKIRLHRPAFTVIGHVVNANQTQTAFAQPGNHLVGEGLPAYSSWNEHSTYTQAKRSRISSQPASACSSKP